MQNKFLFVFIVSGLLGLSGFLLAPRVAAQAPINTSPATAIYLDNQWQYIPPQTTLWFLFDYGGDRSIAELILLDGTPKKLRFNVYTPGQVAGREDGSKPIGRGSAPMVNCDAGKCPSNNLLWKGAFNEAGTYMIEVINDNPIGMPYMLGIVGGSVTLRVPPPQPPQQLVPRALPTPTLALTATTTLTPTLALTPEPTPSATATITAATPITMGNVLFALGSPPQSIPEYARLWFGFGYPAERAQIEIVIPDGAATGLAFLLFAQDANAPNSEIKYIGAASANARDLSWVGEFSTAGAYYVQVVNNTATPQSFQVLVIGTLPGTRR
ncbi:MAG: hypothetical protein HY868_19870 [Chloroflexi bacterium]|nr:hypothetical protein [Chloroflexota bacterium]